MTARLWGSYVSHGTQTEVDCRPEMTNGENLKIEGAANLQARNSFRHLQGRLKNGWCLAKVLGDLPDGFGFRAPDSELLPGPDDIYISHHRSADLI